MSPLILPSVVTNAQAVVQSSLPDTATISRKTSVPNGAGGQTTTWTSVHTGVPCRVEPYRRASRGSEAVSQNLFESVTRWAVVFAVGTDVTNTDRITANGRTFEVLSVIAGQSAGAEVVAECEVVQA